VAGDSSIRLRSVRPSVGVGVAVLDSEPERYYGEKGWLSYRRARSDPDALHSVFRPMNSPEHDVIVVGAGNAALWCRPFREHGASVVVLECAPEAKAGGNSRFAGGVMRFAFYGVDDLRKVADLTDEEIAGADFGTYTRAQ